MNKTAKELNGTVDTVLELPDLNIPEIKSANYLIAYPGKFYDKHIMATKIIPYGSHGYYIYYFDILKDSTTVNAVVVPPDFLFKVKEPSPEVEALVKKYETIKLQNLLTTCGYGGTIGSDPELFVVNGNNGLIPAYDFLPPKEEPVKYSSTTAGDINTLYWDGFQAEFTTHASTCMGWHADSIQAGLEGILKEARKHNPKSRLTLKTVMDINPKFFQTAKPEHIAFGCNASLNAYDMKGLEAPGHEINYRSAGGHIHFGYHIRKPESLKLAVKALDAILGVAGVSMFANYDDPRRRIMYGLAGEYRLPPHGLEYRTLSNAWLTHPMVANLVFDLARTAFMFGINNMMKHWNATEEETINVINTCDVDGARAILKRNETILRALINVRYYGNAAKVDYVYKVIMSGIENVIADPEDIEGNWDLLKTWTKHSNGKNKCVEKVLASKSTEKKI